VDLPDCTTVGQGAFAGCINLSSINLPNLIAVGGSAFYCCSSLTHINLPNYVGFMPANGHYGLTRSGDSAFAECVNVTEIKLGKCQEIALGMFASCVNCTNIELGMEYSSY